MNLWALAGAVAWPLRAQDRSSRWDTSILRFHYTLLNLQLLFHSRCWKCPAHSSVSLTHVPAQTIAIQMKLGVPKFCMVLKLRWSSCASMDSSSAAQAGKSCDDLFSLPIDSLSVLFIFLVYQCILFLSLPCTLEDRHFFFFFFLLTTGAGWAFKTSK